MKFSGHETFPVREGWLHKGLKLLSDNPHIFLDPEVSDYLGVGRNMAKSVKHWLQVTGLAQPVGTNPDSNRTLLHMTKLGELIWQRDPFFLEAGTWWILHINLVNNREAASSWHWFFNKFSHDRFDRAVCLESLHRFIEAEQSRVPSVATIQRDLGCMLLSYARSIPSTSEDPEDGADCPFRDLGLLTYYKTSGYYQLHQGVKVVPLDIFCYALTRAFGDTMQRTKVADIRLQDAARQEGGPGRAFCLTGETLFELVSRLESRTTEFSFLYGCDLSRSVTVADLYDFFSPAMRSDTAVGGTHRQWLETESAISKLPSDDDGIQVLKAAPLATSKKGRINDKDDYDKCFWNGPGRRVSSLAC